MLYASKLAVFARVTFVDAQRSFCGALCTGARPGIRDGTQNSLIFGTAKSTAPLNEIQSTVAK